MRQAVIALTLLLAVPSAAIAEDLPKLRFAQAFYAVGFYADLRTTETTIGRGGYERNQYLIGRQPGDMRLYGTGAAVMVLAVAVSNKTYPRHPRVTFWALIGAGLVHGYYARANHAD